MTVTYKEMHYIKTQPHQKISFSFLNEIERTETYNLRNEKAQHNYDYATGHQVKIKAFKNYDDCAGG